MKYGSAVSFVLIVAAVCALTALPVRAEEKRDLLSASYQDTLEKAREKTNSGDNREALSLLEPFLADPAQYPVAVSDYIVILVWEERFDEAISKYESLPPSFVKKPYLVRNAAKAYYEKKEFSRALTLYKGLLDQTPSDEEVQKGVVYCLVQTGNLNDASAYLEKFQKTSPDSFQLALMKAELLFRRDENSEALKLYRELERRDKIDREAVYRQREHMIGGSTQEKRNALLSELSMAVQSGEKGAAEDYVLTLILNRDYDKAVKVYSEGGIRYSDYLLSWIAWAYFKTGDAEKAKQFYQQILNMRPQYTRAEIGLAYCLAREGYDERAFSVLDELLKNEPRNTEVMFARAFAHESAGRFLYAVQEYDRILDIDPGNDTARKLKVLALSDMGTSSLALEKAEGSDPSDRALLDRVRGDMAAHSIRWKEPRNAMDILSPQAENRENLRAGFDTVVALSENNDMEDAVRSYEELTERGISPPAWVMESAAEAYLYIERPDRSLELYETALKDRPHSPETYNARIGKFYTLQELRKWDEAKQLIEELDRETPETIKRGKVSRPNWPKADLKLAKGWFLLYEDRLQEAETYFGDLHETAPANTNFRTGLAYTYLWRGWSRRALREFNISVSTDEQDINAQIGKITALNALAFKEQAREEAGNLLKAYPKNRHVQALVRRLEMEEKREISGDFLISSDDDGVDDVQGGVRFTQPVSLYTNVYGLFFWQRTESARDGLVSHFNRAGLGMDHVFNSSWKLSQQFSYDYDESEDFGSLTEVTFTPDDHWAVGLSYDSFTTDVPLRARVFGIEADQFRGDITYRESEWRSYRLSHSRMKFSDDNRRFAEMFAYEQGLYTRNNWKTRLFVDLAVTSNSSDNAPYFNPSSDFSLSATHMIEHTIRRIYQKAFLQRLYLSLGGYKQSGFSTYATGSARYEHDLHFSDLHALLYGVSLGRQVFDGEAATAWSFYLTWRYLF